jgi:protein TonB
MKSGYVKLLAASLLCSAGLFAQTTVETATAIEELRKPHEQLAIQDKQKKEPPAAVEYDQAPEMVKQFQPDYPDEAVKNKLEGMVWVSLWIDESGKVAEAKVTKTDNEVFNQAAIDAGKRWIFKPAVAKGKPVAVWVMVPFRFMLNDGAKTPRSSVTFKERVTTPKSNPPDENAKAPSPGVTFKQRVTTPYSNAPDENAKAPSPGVTFKQRVTTPYSNAPDENAKVDQGPEPLKQVIPKYPEAAKRDKIMGTVWTKLWVDKTGRVVQVAVTKSDNELFNQAAIDAAEQWTFKPAMAKGEPVDVWVSLPFKFALK